MSCLVFFYLILSYLILSYQEGIKIFQPVLVGWMILYFEELDGENTNGTTSYSAHEAYGFGAALAISSYINALPSAFYFAILQNVAMRMRAICCALIFRKVCKLQRNNVSADSRIAPSQWETSLQSNAVSHWLGANLESALWHKNWILITVSLCGESIFSARNVSMWNEHIDNTFIQQCFNTLRPRLYGRHFTDDIFKYISVNENVCLPTKISMKSVSKGPNDNIPALVQTMAGCRPGDKPLSESMLLVYGLIYAPLGLNELNPWHISIKFNT